MEAIKKRERLEEAKRLERMKQYKRFKEMKRIENERSKSVSHYLIIKTTKMNIGGNKE